MMMEKVSFKVSNFPIQKLAQVPDQTEHPSCQEFEDAIFLSLEESLKHLEVY